jgi:hypothetical protein
VGDAVPTELLEDQNFILTLARFADGLVSESQVRKKYRLSDESWQCLGQDDALVAKIEEVKLARRRTGESAREKAQAVFPRAVDVLASVMDDPRQSARHRIDACREVRTVSGVGPEAAPAATAEKFMIVINIGNDEILKYPPNDSKPLDVNSKVIEHDRDDEDVADQHLATPWGLFLTATNKQGGEGNGGQPL